MLKRGIRAQSLAKSSRQELWRADTVGDKARCSER